MLNSVKRKFSLLFLNMQTELLWLLPPRVMGRSEIWIRNCFKLANFFSRKWSYQLWISYYNFSNDVKIIYLKLKRYLVDIISIWFKLQELTISFTFMLDSSSRTIYLLLTLLTYGGPLVQIIIKVFMAQKHIEVATTASTKKWFYIVHYCSFSFMRDV